MRKTIVVLMALVASSVLARSFDTGYEPPGLDELDKQKGLFKTTLIRPDADFSRFTKIKPQTVALVIRDPGAANQFSTGRLLAKRDKESVIPEYDEVVEFKRIVGDTLAGQLAQNLDLDVVDNADPDTLILQPVVTEVEITTSSKNISDDGHELPELQEATIVFDLMDGETGEILARFAEKKRNRPPKDERVTTGLWPNLPFWVRTAAVDLCEELRLVRGGST